MEYSTEFYEKAGRQIHIDDILQLRLGLSSKHGGASRVRVILFGKNVHYVAADAREYPYGGVRLSKSITEFAVVIDCPHIYRHD